MERELTNNYSIYTFQSQLTDASNIYNFIQDSNGYNQANIIDMIHNLRNDNVIEEHVDHLNVSQSSSDTISSYNIWGEASLLSNNNQLTSSIVISDDPFFDGPNYMLLKTGRAATAPAKPFNDGEEFKWSPQYLNLEKAVLYSNRLLINKIDYKIDVDSEEGSEICKKFLEQLEKLIKSLKVKTTSREYRKSFSRAYKCLYQTGNLCYLTEILESAQEGQKSLWVNGDEFHFSQEVLDYGNSLYKSFYDLLIVLRDCHQKIKDDSFYENIQGIKSQLKKELEEFDKKWVDYEQKYINELIYIENESRRLITDAIKIEKSLNELENKARCKGKFLLDSIEYNTLRGKLIEVFNQINRVANYEGKGRDDLSLEILTSAETVLRKISDNKSKSVRHLADSIKQSFLSLRKLLQKYDDNIELVDPQLKHNPELVDLITNFERTWERGKEFLLDPVKYCQLLFFSQMIDILCEKHKEISDELESREPSIFVWIPSILILKSLDNEDKNICKEYNPTMFLSENEESGKAYSFLQSFKSELYIKVQDPYYAYNLLEKLVLFESDKSNEAIISQYIDTHQIHEFKTKIKILSMQLQRIKPSDWNHFFDLAMNL